ncbi:hypothetical protein FQ775_20535 [Nitratireductor mangrovi]|uniref:Uncharacterized protein n=1 Tax=Nitratireductor mangrovi TaxID=2599600 RepID=A0A5B8L3K7_9HYPH|nr:hypothetical protein [Nitratireductor mangrovi]QDZ02567.1 hypothetical protein FQ775_20535 [Nitratireductor mangrovi]
MIGMMALDRLAADRTGEGLHPRLRELLAERLEAQRAGVIDMAAFAGDHAVQAGPNPLGTCPGELPEGVVAFKGPSSVPAPQSSRSRATR